MLLLVDLVDPPNPLLIKADGAVVLAEHSRKCSVGLPRESDVVGSHPDLMPPNDYVGHFGSRPTFISDQVRASGMEFTLKPKLAERRDQVVWISNFG